MKHLPNKYYVSYKEIEINSSEISKDTYDQDFKTICTLENVGNILYFLEHLKEFEDVKQSFYINVFREGINPVWEDENNKNGCNWSIILKKEVSQRYFEKLVVRLCTGFFKTFEPTGIVGINKDNNFKLSLWSRNIPLHSEYSNVINEIKSALDINFGVSFQFKNHSRLLKPFEKVKKTL